MANARSRLGGQIAPSSFATNEQSQNYIMSTTGPSSQHLTSWPPLANKWPPIGTGMKSSDGSRGQGKPPPLLKAGFSSDKQGGLDIGSLENSEPITGSSSLLSTSEQDGWSRSQWTSSSISAGLSSARTNHTSTSPVRQRTNQQTRSSSPYFSSQPATGQPTTTKPSNHSHLDPTTTAFRSSIFSSNQQPGYQFGRDGDDAGRRTLDSIRFGETGINGNTVYSGYTSSAASRSGSLPPSRRGVENGSQLGDYGASQIHQSNSDIFGHRANQHSRNSAFSTNGYGRADQIWQTNASDLSTMASRMDLNKDEIEASSNHPWSDQINPLQPPGTINTYFNGYSRSRQGSLALEAGMQSTSTTPFNQYRAALADRPSHSPTSSDPRQSRGSPLYINGTPPLPDHSRAYPTNNGQNRLTMHDQALLERKLRNVQLAQQQNNLRNPAVSYRNPYNNMFDYSSQNMPSYHRLNPQVAQYHPIQNMHNVPIPGYISNNHFPRPPPRGPALDSSGGENLRSALLEEFRNSKGGRRYELKDIYDHVVEFSGDQHGSRFIQQKLETANSDEKARLFKELHPNARQLMTDVFGNYVIQKFFEHGNQQQKKQLADNLKGHVAELSTQMYGCRVVQKAFEHVLVDQQAELVKELEHQVLKCVKDQNGNHVIQKAIQWIPLEHTSFIVNAFTNQVHHLSVHSYGCRVVQRILEYCKGPAKARILEELHSCASLLIVDQYGNYVTQHTIQHGRPEDRAKIINLIMGQFINYSTHKYASNVVEKSIEYATPEQLQRMIEIATTTFNQRVEPTLERLARDNYGNYVIQRLVRQLENSSGSDGQEYQGFVNKIRTIMPKLKLELQSVTHGSHGKQLSQIERVITHPQAGSIEGSTSTSNQPSKSEAPSEAKTNTSPPQIDTSPTPPLVNEDVQSPQSSSHPSTDNNSVDGRIGDGSIDARKSQPSIPAQVAGDDSLSSESASTITAGVQ